MPVRIGTAPARRGVTLIELLLVMGILTILATLSLTTVKGLLKDQKVTQAARLVEQYIESGRVRALTNGRPVAVFMERVSVTGDAAGNAIPSNYTATRLSIGEVFPPYTGDVISASGAMYDIDMDLHNPDPSSRHYDGFADQIRFDAFDVASGFGTGGFVSVGDSIEFEGYVGRFGIEAIELTADGQIGVTFFNPPDDYNAIRYARLDAGSGLDTTFEATHARVPPEIPVVGTELSNRTVSSSGVSTSLGSVRFRVYRRPTKSLVGAITLPRGTCVDLSASGFGSGSAGAGANVTSPFYLGVAPSAAAVTPSSYSRIAILFTADGRLSGVIVETNIAGSKAFFATDASQILHLMVGRTDQVAPGDLSSELGRKQALLTRTPPNAGDPFQSNLLDPGNTWITCNPFTGEIKSAPVSAVSEATLSATRTAVSADSTVSIAAVVQEARALSTAGVESE